MGRILVFFPLLLFVLGIFGCGEEGSNGKEIPDNAPVSYGTVLTVDQEMKRIELDITQWAEENGYMAEDNKTDVGKMDKLKISEDTLIRYENGTKATFENIRENQTIEVLKEKNGEVTELRLLDE